MRASLVLILTLGTLGGCQPRTYHAQTLEATPESVSRGILAAKSNVQRTITSLKANPYYRTGAEPYLMIHEADFQSKGTVVLFHGFSNAPQQMSPMAQYLFDAGFDIYNANVAGHGLLNQDDASVPVDQRVVNWPRVKLRDSNRALEQTLVKRGWAEKLKQGIDPAKVGEMVAAEMATCPIGDRVAIAADAALCMGEFQRIKNASEGNEAEPFDALFDSTHMDYLKAATNAYNDVKTLRGPFFTVGLSAGASMALALGAAFPDKFKAVAAFTPLMEVGHKDPKKAAETKTAVRDLGPIQGIAPWFGWPPKPMFPLGAFTALDRFGRTHLNTKEVWNSYWGDDSRPAPKAFIVTTFHEDAADTEVTEGFFSSIGGTAHGHWYFNYGEKMYVPHPVSAITERSQGMINMYYETLYQETLRFFTTAEVKIDRLAQQDLDPNLPGYVQTLDSNSALPLPAKVNLQEVK